MHRRAAELYAVFQRFLMDLEAVVAGAAEGGDQGGMDVHDGVGVGIHQFLGEDDHAAGQNNQGVYHLLKGELDKAESCFNKAKELGSEQADANLEETSKKHADNRAFGEK